MSLASGAFLGPYEILGAAGAGGMGEVYRARDKAQLSPDGRWLAYHSTESGRDEVYLQPFPATGERWQVSTAGGNDPQWRGDGKELFFLAGKALTAVDIKASGKSVEIGIPHKLFDTNGYSVSVRNRYVPAADGQKFLVVRRRRRMLPASMPS